MTAFAEFTEEELADPGSHALIVTIDRRLYDRFCEAARRLRAFKVREPVLWFAGRMEEKLRDNDHKGHWARCEPSYLSRRLEQELGELRRVLARVHWPNPTPEQREAVIREAADVANFAMMLGDNLRDPAER